jgi:hypothetical protein
LKETEEFTGIDDVALVGSNSDTLLLLVESEVVDDTFVF